MLIKSLEKVALLGSSWVLYLLIALSALSIGIMIDRWIFFRRFSGDADALGDGLVAHLRVRDLAGAEALLKKSSSIEAQVILTTLQWLGGGADAVSEAIEAAMNRKRKDLERGLVFLGTLGNNAPFIGLLGTVIGVLDAFHGLAAAGGGQNQSAMGNVMLQISEALVATGVGLMVALPAVVGFNLAQKKVSQVEANVMTIGKQMLTVLKAEPFIADDFRAQIEAGAVEAHPASGDARARLTAEPEPS